METLHLVAWNLLAAAGVFIGLGMLWSGDGSTGTVVVLVAAAA